MSTITDRELGKRLQYFLNVKGYKQKDFAKVCNIDEATLTRYIKGQREPKCSTAMIMAYNLGISLDDFTGMNELLTEKYTNEL